jgi:NurA domain
MAINFQQVRAQVKTLGENAAGRASQLHELRQRALELLNNHAGNLEGLRQRVQVAARRQDPNLRCAIPCEAGIARPEPLDGHYPLPGLPREATILAADGSQITPDRHAQVNFCLINVGAIQVRMGAPDPPQITVSSKLFYDEQLYTLSGTLSEAQVALMRDLNERKMLVELVKNAPAPVITFTDGPMELWGAKETQDSQDFQRSLEEYQQVLLTLQQLGATTAGYVDKPAANLVVRLLEVASLSEEQLPQVKRLYPLRGVLDRQLFQRLLNPGERSAVFAIQSRSGEHYLGELALHFFYLNVGRSGKPWLARVEIPAWVAADSQRLGDLQAVLVQQCRILGSRPFPYLIQRAHEAGVVSLEEKAQVEQMIANELYRRGVEVDDVSSKQFAKDQTGRARYKS